MRRPISMDCWRTSGRTMSIGGRLIGSGHPPSTLWTARNDGRWIECLVRLWPSGVNVESAVDGHPMVGWPFETSEEALAYAERERRVVSRSSAATSPKCHDRPCPIWRGALNSPRFGPPALLRTTVAPRRNRRANAVGLGNGHAGVAKLCLLDVLLLSALCVANCKFVSVSDDVTMLIDPMVDSQLLPQR